jgi:hypothetical protein
MSGGHYEDPNGGSGSGSIATTTPAPVTAPAPAPAPKIADPVQSPRVVPTADELLHPATPDYANLDDAVLMESITHSVDTLYQLLRESLATTITHLKAPPPPPEPDLIAALLQRAAQLVASFGLMWLAHAVPDGMQASGSSSTSVNAVRDSLRNLAKDVSVSVTANGSSVDKTSQAHGAWADPGATNLLDEYKVETEHELDAQRDGARTQVGELRVKIARAGHKDLAALASSLQSLKTDNRLFEEFAQRVVTQWLDFNARLAIHAPPPPKQGEPDTGAAMAGANRIGGYESAGNRGVQSWQAHDGFVHIALEVPDRIDGLAGIRLERASVSLGPEALTILKSMHASLVTIPTFRMIWLTNSSQGKLADTPAFVLTPEQKIEVDAGNPILASIGSGQPVDFEDAMQTRERSATNPLSPPPATMIRSQHAQLGARAIMTWLTALTTDVLS